MANESVGIATDLAMPSLGTTSMKAIVLAYHSHHVLGTDYSNNDHVAFPVDLELATQAGYQIVSLDTIVDTLLAIKSGDSPSKSDKRYLALTFDDGPVFDFEDFSHPQFGRQRGFVGAMQDFLKSEFGTAQRALIATSFVIASPDARAVMEAHVDPEYTYLVDGALNHAWWNHAIDSRLLSIANHSWDHLHPNLERVAHSGQVRADFTKVLSKVDADAQIATASRYIRDQTHGRAVPYFAYPFGHYNAFLTQTYFPSLQARGTVRGAFTTDGRPVSADDSVWALPRFVCGDHWKSPEELVAILGR